MMTIETIQRTAKLGTDLKAVEAKYRSLQTAVDTNLPAEDYDAACESLYEQEEAEKEALKVAYRTEMGE